MMDFRIEKEHKEKTGRICPKCKRKLIKIRTRGISLPFLGPGKGTKKYYKCRVCQYREMDRGKKAYVLTEPGGKILK